MATLNVLGMDPSLSNWGFAFGKYDLGTRELQLSDLQLAQTKKSKHKQIRVNSNDLSRAKLLADAAFEAARLAQVVFVEIPTGSQSARAMASYGIAIGILASMRSQYQPFIEVTPMEIKMATIGESSASKQRIIFRAVGKWPTLPWPTVKDKGTTRVVVSKCEHLADAIGAIEAGVKTEQFAQLIAVHESNT